MYYRLKLIETKKISKKKNIAYPFVSIVIIFYMFSKFYTGYVFKTYGVNKNAHNHSSHQIKTKE